VLATETSTAVLGGPLLPQAQRKSIADDIIAALKVEKYATASPFQGRRWRRRASVIRLFAECFIRSGGVHREDISNNTSALAWAIA
jgi:hypothetical protein